MRLTTDAVTSLEWVRDYIQSTGNLPARNLTDFELSKHYAQFGYATEESFRGELMQSPFLTAVKMIIYRNTVAV